MREYHPFQPPFCVCTSLGEKKCLHPLPTPQAGWSRYSFSLLPIAEGRHVTRAQPIGYWNPGLWMWREQCKDTEIVRDYWQRRECQEVCSDTNCQTHHPAPVCDIRVSYVANCLIPKPCFHPIHSVISNIEILPMTSFLLKLVRMSLCYLQPRYLMNTLPWKSLHMNNVYKDIRN